MADRIIKGDSGNDVIIQNNAGSRKIEVTNSGDVEVTGDVKTTTVKTTNLKANDGTAGLVVADSTGEVTSSGGLKAVNVKATNIKANDGTAGISIADSTGRLSVTESNPVITLGSNAVFPTGHIIKSGLLLYHNSSSDILTNLTTFTNTGLAGTLTTLKSSSDSRLEIFVKCGYSAHEISNNGQATLTLGSASDTSYDADDDIINSSVTGQRNYSNNVSGSLNFVNNPTYIFHYNTSQTSPVNAFPVNLTSYSAGQTLYWRIFLKSGGSNRFFIYASNTFLTVHYYEIEK
tara:strand:- start:811 stop:1680 length:870 start_codon:yes stop_codon:yes gene_type:complete